MTTPIEQLTTACEGQKIAIDVDRFRDNVFDFSLSQSDRVDALNRYYEEDPDNIHEVISKLMSIYNLTNLSLLKRFLCEFVLHSSIPLIIRLDCTITLTYNDSSSSIGYSLLETLCEQMDDNIPVAQHISSILHLLNSQLYNDSASKFLYTLLRNQSIPEEMRYKTILGLEKSVHHNGKELGYECARQFLDNDDNSYGYRILAGQYLIRHNIDNRRVEALLLSFARDESLEDNTRADASDVLLHIGSSQSVQEAQRILSALGGMSLHLFDNKQNVHTTEVEQSVKDTIGFLDTCKLYPMPTFSTVKYNVKELAFQHYRPSKHVVNEKTGTLHLPSGEDYVYSYDEEQIVHETDMTKEEELVEQALVRIELDRAIFKHINHSLESVFLMVYTYIQKDDINKKQLEIRLLEELIDMAGTCTSGYLSRLVNVLSGFGSHTLHISWKDQIKANLAGRLNARMRTMKNKDELLEQMTNPDMGDKPAFLEFFREHISNIKEEMYLEFRDFMDDTDWDLYFKKALMVYQG